MFSFLKKLSEEDKTLVATLKGLTGKTPKNLGVYKLALRHSSITDGESNERLEFLGDAVLGSIVGEFLFKKFPFKDEGFLTEIRSRIVKRDSLNTLSRQVGVDNIINSSLGDKITNARSIYGNALEAMIGAIYLDRGYKFTYSFVVQRIIGPHIDIKHIVENNYNFKSMLIEWGQKNDKKIKFKISNEEGANHKKIFTAQVLVDEEVTGSGSGHSKKKSEQAAAEKAWKRLNPNL